MRERGVEFDVIEYLKNPLTKSDLKRVLELLSNKPGDLVRNDKKFKELGLNHDNYQTPAAVIDLLLEHPVLMQRPIAIKGDRAVISRPATRIEELLG